MIRYRFVFSKTNECGITSFLKQIEYFKNFFISNFELYDGKKSKFSFGPALSFGYESECEYVDVFLKYRISDEEIKMIVDKNIGIGYSVVSFKSIPVHFPSVESVVDAIEYDIHLNQNIDLDVIYNCEHINRNLILELRNNCNILTVILRKGLSLKTIFEHALKDITFEKIIRKKLYWQDLSGDLRII